MLHSLLSGPLCNKCVLKISLLSYCGEYNFLNLSFSYDYEHFDIFPDCDAYLGNIFIIISGIPTKKEISGLVNFLRSDV